MSDAESFVEDENKIKIEETCINLDCVKKEPKEETFDIEDDRQYRIALEYRHLFGESSSQRKFEEDYDNLIGFMDNDVIMENRMIKLEYFKEEDGSFNSFHCSKCKGNYKGYCFKCSTLAHILNNNKSLVNSESQCNTVPSDILEIRDTSAGKGVFLLRTLPINIIFGPFEGILGIESTVGHCWKINDNKLVNIKNGNWMKNIVCAANATLKNLDNFQIDGNLYFRTNREITEGEELLIYYDDKELRPLDNSEECLYTPEKQEKLPRIFACTLCCLGFGSNECLMEHKNKCPQVDHNRSIIDFELIECHYCKMWMEKWEHEEYHVAHCLEKHHRRRSDYSEAVSQSEMDVDEIKDDCNTKDNKGTYERNIYSKANDCRDNLQFDTKDYLCSLGTNNDTHLTKYALVKRRNNEHTQNTDEKKHKCSECSFETRNKTNLQNHLNRHRGIKPFQCGICMMKFAVKYTLQVHIKNRHAEHGSGKDYKCPECPYQTNYKCELKTHLNGHSGIKPFECAICLIKYTTKSCLARHIKDKHAENGRAKDYKCPECSYQTNYKTHFQNHLNTHIGIKPFKCDKCLTTFTEKSSLKMHIMYKHTEGKHIKRNQITDGKDYKCSECFYVTNYKHHLLQHLNKHKGVKAFQCGICLVSVTTKQYLKIHMNNKHTHDESVKYYKCSECSMKYTDKGNLTKHVKNKHAANGSAKDYKCTECSYQTNYKSDLRKHSSIHTDIKPFQCDICMKKFSRKDYLKSHVKHLHTIL